MVDLTQNYGTRQAQMQAEVENPLDLFFSDSDSDFL